MKNKKKFFLSAIFRKDAIGNLVWTIPHGEYYSVSDDVIFLLSEISQRRFLFKEEILTLNYNERTISKLISLGIISGLNDLNLRWYNTLSIEEMSHFHPPPPTTIEWYPTFDCNQSCRFCYISRFQKDETSPNNSEIINLLQHIKGTGILKVALLGGEPILWENLPFFLQQTCNLPYDISLSSNGIVYSEEIVQIAKVHRTFQISISIHSGSLNEHDKIVGLPGAYSKTIKNIKKYISNGIRCSIACVYCVHLEETYNELIIFCSKNNIKCISFLYNQDEDASLLNKSYFNLFERYITQAIEIGKKNNVKVNAPNFYVFLSKYRKVYFSAKSDRTIWLYGLKDGKTRLDVTPRGDVFPSFRLFYDKRFKLGNLYDQNLKDLWINSDVHNFFNKKLPTECNTCIYLNICGGGNIFKNFKKYGEFFLSPPNCPIYQ